MEGSLKLEQNFNKTQEKQHNNEFTTDKMFNTNLRDLSFESKK